MKVSGQKDTRVFFLFVLVYSGIKMEVVAASRNPWPQSQTCHAGGVKAATCGTKRQSHLLKWFGSGVNIQAVGDLKVSRR